MNPRPQSSLVMASHLVKTNLKYFLAIWLLLCFGAAVATAIVSSLTNPTMSILDFTTMPPRYWILACGIVFPIVIARIYVAHGVTRSHLSGGVAIAAVAVAVILALLMAAAFATEYLFYQASGWEAVVNGHLFTSTGQFGLVFGEFAVIYLGHFLAGWTIGMLFARFSKITALALLIPAFLPAVAVEWLLGAGWSGNLWVAVVEGDRLSTPVALAICLIIMAGQTMINHRMMRTLPVPAKTN